MYTNFEIVCKKQEKSQFYYGQHKPIFFLKNKLIFTIGPHWKVFCIAMSILLLISILMNVNIYKKCRKKAIKIIMEQQEGANEPLSEEIADNEVSILSSQFTLFFFFLTVSLLQHFTYLWVFLKNPGIVYKPEYNPATSRRASITRMCSICKAFKNSQRCHCMYCEICIEQYSHHCPWIGKCVGINNHTSFQYLKFFTALYFLVGIFVLCWKI
ncbi:DHHC zinc finger protein (macronuclear) [Tetrahymena thermophila SB210]|uniref:Palmitoyltransferase n=1 Tax=Tetrahymena thermophila (strain SB210) TaxID=312017 RepID=W7XF80_TETTS|nr:DHHC zinc finger protein [Tetrahymena thermophila SB210]EWS71424.1 DHHC zinc finger protein [Tetrahymena thermophila SB210]|eukprot:XP_012656044.1 DHHC zinc finger protein [Tetrahymena thermophila SB210]